MKARVDSRDQTPVEGALYLRHVPVLDYVQVRVVGKRGSWTVDPDSIEVLRPQAVPIAELEEGDPLVHDPRWRRVVDLEEARSAGLVGPSGARQGGSWEDMYAALDRIVAPLLEAGWREVSRDREEDPKGGDSVWFELERGQKRIEVELLEGGGLIAWPLEAIEDKDDPDEPSEPLFSLDEASAEFTREAFRREGWLDTASEREPSQRSSAGQSPTSST